MGGASEKSRQKKLEKHKKKRGRASDLARLRDAKPVQGVAALVGHARAAPFGPVWVSESLDCETDPPGLVTVVVARRLQDGLLLAEVVLVDRTCLGVKNAFLMPPATELELERCVREMGERGVSMARRDPLVAQSVVFHALDYARSLGFRSHPDFVGALFDPRPAELLDTPQARPARPWYVSGPDDDVPGVLRQLARAVGADGYEFLCLADSMTD